MTHTLFAPSSSIHFTYIFQTLHNLVVKCFVKLILFNISSNLYSDLCILKLFCICHSPLSLTFNPCSNMHFTFTKHNLNFLVSVSLTIFPSDYRFLPLPEGILCLIASMAFSAEYLLFYFHSTSHKGLEGYYHTLLVFQVGLCVLSSIAGALMPNNFPVDLCNGIAIALQGIWFYQTAFVLYGPMMPDGCKIKENHITCNSVDSEVRGELLANFQFFAAILAVLVATVVAYGYAASRYGNSEVNNLHTVQDELDQN